MAERGAVGKDTPCIVCGGNAERGRTLSGATPITETGYRAGFFRVCKQCHRDPRIAAEKLTVKVGQLKASIEFLETIVVPAMNRQASDHRLRINE
jgi:hypothetical protein